MKKIIFAAIAFATIALVSCGNEDPAKPVKVNTEQYGTIEGFIIMKQNLKPNNDNKTFYSSPEKVEILATVSYSDLTENETAKGVYSVKDIAYEKSTGKFVIKAPVSSQGSEVKIIINPIYGTQTQYDAVNDKWVDVDGVYKYSGSIDVSVNPGQTFYQGDVELTFTKTTQNESEVK